MKRIQLYWQQVPTDAKLTENTPFFFFERKGNILYLGTNNEDPQSFLQKFGIAPEKELHLWFATLLFPETLENKDELRKLLVFASQPVYNSHTHLAEKKEYKGSNYLVISFGTEWLPTKIQAYENRIFYHDFYPPKEFKDLIKVRW